MDNVEQIQASLIVEGANHPIIPEADRYLADAGVIILPDFVVNAGTAELFTIGMLGSCDVDEEVVLEKIEQITNNAVQKMCEISFEMNISLRESAKKVSSMKLWRDVI